MPSQKYEDIKAKQFKFDKAIQALEIFERIAIENYIIYHDSFENYCKGIGPSPKRLKMFYLSWMIIITGVIICFIIFLYHDDDFIRKMGVPVYMIPMKVRGNIFFAMLMLSAIILVFKLALLHFEHQGKFFTLNMFNYWMKFQDFNLSNTNEIKFAIKIIKWVCYIRLSCASILGIYMVILYMLSLEAHLTHNYSIVKLLVYNLICFLFAKHTVNSSLFSIGFIYFTITFLNYKFDDILQSLKVKIWWNNSRGIVTAIATHHKTTDLIHRLSRTHNVAIGLLNLIFPYFIGLLLKTLLIPGVPLSIRLYLFIVCTFSYINMNIINAICATVTVRNRNAFKQLYRVFCSYKYINLQYRLKILLLLEKMTGDYVGFYCFNMFKYTKMASFKYYLTLITAYIFMTKMSQIKNNMLPG